VGLATQHLTDKGTTLFDNVSQPTTCVGMTFYPENVRLVSANPISVAMDVSGIESGILAPFRD
jgi:hypothetical protein